MELCDAHALGAPLRVRGAEPDGRLERLGEPLRDADREFAAAADAERRVLALARREALVDAEPLARGERLRVPDSVSVRVVRGLAVGVLEAVDERVGKRLTVELAL